MNNAPDFFLIARKMKAAFEKRLRPLFEKALLGKQALKKKKDGEMVGWLDGASGKEMKSIIAEDFPGCPVLSEEGKHDWRKWSPRAEKFFVIDPCDGTHNIGTLTPMCGAMLALVERGDVKFSVIWLPFYPLRHRGFYFALRGGGAWQHIPGEGWRRLAVSQKRDIKEVFVWLEGARNETFGRELAFNLRAIIATRRARFGMSSCWSGTRLASGKSLPMSIDVLISNGNKPTDNLPLVLLVEEAGGKVTDHCGRKWSPENCSDLVFSNGHLHDYVTALKLLRREQRVIRI